MKEYTENKTKRNLGSKDIVAFASIHGNIEMVSQEKLAEIGREEMKFINSIHFLNQ
jgi:hypothetical protein